MAGALFSGLLGKLRGRQVDWEEIEEALLRADLGVPMTQRILEELRARSWHFDAESAASVIREEVLKVFPQSLPPLFPLPDRPLAVLMVGVNGTGKTTTTAKLAHRLIKSGRSVVLAAADTFRAAAIEQLEEWGRRLGAEVVKGQYGGDSAALCYDAYTSALKRKADFLICDTAGRLHTKDNLMRELEKVSRTLAKHDPEAPHEKFLVVDATTGSNALAQAKEFHSAIGLTGVVLTKLDGSGKGGVAVAIGAELGIPTRFLGSGEKPDDLRAFDKNRFVEEMV